MEKLTMSNTKDVILNAYNEAIKKVKELEKIKLNPEKEVAEKKASVILQKAEAVTAADVSTKVKEVSDAVAKALADLLEKIQLETENYTSVVEAIKIKKAELKDLFGIETDASTLAALINSKNDILDTLDAAIADKRAENAKEISDLVAGYTAKKVDLEAEVKKFNADTLAARAKDEAEYKYNFNRQKMLDKDAWEDEKKKARQEFEADKAADQAELSDRFKAVEAREVAVLAKETEVAVLESKVAEIPTLIEAAVNKAVADKEKSLNTAFAIEKNYLKKDADSQKLLADAKIENLTEALAAEKARANTLAAKLDEAYGKIEAMAKSSIEGASKANYASSLETMLREKQTGTTK